MSESQSPKVELKNGASIIFTKASEEPDQEVFFLSIHDQDPSGGMRRMKQVELTSDQMNDLINAAQNLYYDAPSEKILKHAEAFRQVEQEYEDVKLKELMKEAIREFMWDANQRALTAFNHQHHIMTPPMPFPFVGVGPYAPH